ncbi:MAG: nucleotidyltransferase family protein [Anaerolineales bacterium]|nr:nucleotidyltransferase family protein [Anaerolineales bacterium]
MTVNSKDQLLSLLRANQRDIRNFGIRRLGLFGSFVREQQRRDSDVDVLIEFEPGQKTYDNFIKLAFFLEELLGRRVELITTDALSPYIGPHILEEVEYVAL